MMAISQDIRYEKKVVAFLDILGFRRLVYQNKTRAIKVISDLDEGLRHALECLEMENGPDFFSAKLFSDCFCLSCADIDLDVMLRELALMQLSLSMRGIFLRGAVAEGPHFENERMIFSEGLIEAYEVHQGEHYPRIRFTEAICGRIRKETSSNYGCALRNYLVRAPDGIYFLDYLQAPMHEEGLNGEIDWFFEEHKNAILKQVRANVDSYEVVEKYRLLAEYHNFKFGQLYEADDYVEGYFEELSEKLIIPLSVFPSFKKEEGEFAKVNGVE